MIWQIINMIYTIIIFIQEEQSIYQSIGNTQKSAQTTYKNF
jgi:hypothetical protein